MEVGLDIGYGEIKAVSRNDEGSFSFVVFPSVYAVHVPSPMSDGDESSIVTFGGEKYVVGQEAKLERGHISPADFTDIVKASGIYSMFLKRQIGAEGETNIVASVPPRWWTEREKYRSQLQTMFDDVAIVPQGLGAARAMMNNLHLGSRYMVIDIGYRTVDHLIVQVVEKNGQIKIETRRGGSWINDGVVRLAEIFKDQIEYPDIRNLKFPALKDFLRDGYANFHGERFDLSGAKQRAEKNYKQQLSSLLKSELSGGIDYIDSVIVAGGGVYYIDPENIFQGLPALVPENPEFANAYGQVLMVEKEA
jgi:hypothetical protein